MVFLKEGVGRPLPRDSSLTLRVDDFDIVTTELTGDPGLRIDDRDHRGARGYASRAATSRSITRCEWGGVPDLPERVHHRRERISRARAGVFAARGGRAARVVDLVPGVAPSIGDSTITVTARSIPSRFPDGPGGRVLGEPLPGNPALEVEVVIRRRGRSAAGSFSIIGDFRQALRRRRSISSSTGCEPVYYTGLEVSANPGAGVLFAGFAAATLGLLLMYLCNPRVVKGVATPDALVVAGVEYRWKASFEREFAEMREAIRKEIGRRG